MKAATENKQKAKKSSDSTSKSGLRFKRPLRCGVCGAYGHSRNSKICPRYGHSPSFKFVRRNGDEEDSDSETREGRRALCTPVKAHRVDGPGGDKRQVCVVCTKRKSGIECRGCGVALCIGGIGDKKKSCWELYHLSRR